MEYLRTYGRKPYDVIVIHGGPGAPGEMAPVARELSVDHGVLEILHRAATLDGQVAELLSAVEEHGDILVTLVGHSWGAMLAYIFAAGYPMQIQ